MEDKSKMKQKTKGDNNVPDWKTRSTLALFLLLVVTVTFVWLYVRNTQPKISEAQTVLNTVKKLDQEKKRCSQLINQESGEFAEYNYCNRFLEKFPP